MKIGLTHRTVAGHVAVEQLAEQTELLLLSRSMCNTHPDSRQTAIELISPQAPPEELEPREDEYWLRVTEPKPKQAGSRMSALSRLHGIVTTVISKEKENERRKKIPKVKREG